MLSDLKTGGNLESFYLTKKFAKLIIVYFTRNLHENYDFISKMVILVIICNIESRKKG